MKIRTKLWVTVSVSIATVAIVGAVIFLSLQRLNAVRGEAARIQTVQKEEAELRSTTFEYLTYHEQRMFLQWLSKYAKITKLLDGLQDEHKESRDLIEEIHQNHKNVGDLFGIMTRAFGESRGNGTLSSGKTRPEPSARERETILGGQLLLRTQHIVSNLLQLSAHTSRVMADAQERMALAVVLSVLLLVAVITAAFLTIMKSLVKPLARLTAGAERIGAGDLTRRIEVKSEDEIGRLGDAFNHMAAELERRVAGLSALNVVGTVINETVELEQLLTRTLEEGLRLVGVEAGAVLLLDEGAGGLALAAHRGLSDELVQAAQWLKLGEGLAGRAAQIGQPVVMGETAEYHGALKALVERDRIQSVASVPLLGRTGVIGVMNLVTRNPHYFDAAGLELLTSLGRQIAVGIEKARLFEAVQRELTERRRAEEEILRLNAELEQRVLERTAQLDATNKELESFSYSVAHDLRAPLRAIDGFSQALLEDYAGGLDDQGRDHLQRVRDGSQRMAHLIDDMLKLSRVTRAELRREEVDLSALARDIAAELRRGHPDREVEFSASSGLRVRGDPRLLRIAIENLLDNAWKFTHGRNPARIELGMRPEPDGKPAYFVRDNGVGFDMAYSGKLFGAFQRLHNAREFHGTGIGLATVQRVIHKHGGKVWAEGAVGKGATFFFTL